MFWFGLAFFGGERGEVGAGAVLNKKDVTGLRQKRHSVHERKSITKLGLQNC